MFVAFLSAVSLTHHYNIATERLHNVQNNAKAQRRTSLNAYGSPIMKRGPFGNSSLTRSAGEISIRRKERSPLFRVNSDEEEFGRRGLDEFEDEPVKTDEGEDEIVDEEDAEDESGGGGDEESEERGGASGGSGGDYEANGKAKKKDKAISDSKLELGFVNNKNVSAESEGGDSFEGTDERSGVEIDEDEEGENEIDDDEEADERPELERRRDSTMNPSLPPLRKTKSFGEASRRWERLKSDADLNESEGLDFDDDMSSSSPGSDSGSWINELCPEARGQLRELEPPLPEYNTTSERPYRSSSTIAISASKLVNR